ncbi:MAG: hypothetical protein EOL86_11620 [Deltaproteobacteria bacterium]|nr:hypothetical protein [Deltaproteobacteria bacterium]
MYDGLSDESPALRRFRELLRTCPLCAVVTDGRILLCAVQFTADRRRLVENYDWLRGHWPEFCEAADLFWLDSEVFAWVEAHPCARQGVTYRTMYATTPALDAPELCVLASGENSSDG